MWQNANLKWGGFFFKDNFIAVMTKSAISPLLKITDGLLFLTFTSIDFEVSRLISVYMYYNKQC